MPQVTHAHAGDSGNLSKALPDSCATALRRTVVETDIGKSAAIGNYELIGAWLGGRVQLLKNGAPSNREWNDAKFFVLRDPRLVADNPSSPLFLHSDCTSILSFAQRPIDGRPRQAEQFSCPQAKLSEQLDDLRQKGSHTSQLLRCLNLRSELLRRGRHNCLRIILR